MSNFYGEEGNINLIQEEMRLYKVTCLWIRAKDSSQYRVMDLKSGQYNFTYDGWSIFNNNFNHITCILRIFLIEAIPYDPV